MSLLRLLLWIVIIFIAWKIIRLISAAGGRKSDIQPPQQPFSRIEDADFEDITPPDPKEEKKE